MGSRVLLFLVFICTLSAVASQGPEAEGIIFQDRANGSAAVLLSVGRIQQSGVFGNDNDILRRIAYVETRDGTLSGTFREGYNGGIWAVDEDAFRNTQNTDAFARLPAKIEQIEELLQINWLDAEWSDLRKPLYSALAARLIIFNAPTSVPPPNDLVGQAQFWVEYYNRNGEASDFVTTSTGLEGAILESSANEFFVGFSHNLDQPTLHLFVTTAESTPVRFVVTASGFRFTGIATDNSTAVVDLPITLEVTSTAERNKGIHVKAEGERKIVVYGLSYSLHSTDAYLALPCNSLAVDEYQYYGMTYPSPNWPSHILLVGCEDNTVVTTPSTTFTLNRLETYLLPSSNSTGMRITSTNPVSFFSNQECTNIPVGVGACDHLTEQIPSTSTWGNSFFAASLLGRTSGEIFRVLTSRDSTTVTVNCTTFTQVQNYTLSTAGTWQEFMIRPLSFCNIESTAPVLLVQFGLGNGIDMVGDPFMSMIPPVEQYSNRYVLNVLPEFSTNYITIYVATKYYQPDRIFVDGLSQEGTIWTVVYCSNRRLCGYIARVPLTPGEHRLLHRDSNARIGVSAYGFNHANSYGYTGGLELTPVQLATVSFAEESYRVSEGTGTLVINITRSGDTDIAATVLVATDNFEGTASVKEDYTSVSTIVEFQPGETQQQISVRINNDKRIERNETFQLYLTAGAGVHLSPFPRTDITIENDDGMIILDPPYGGMLGGSGVAVTGDNLFLSEDDNIMCSFDGIEVSGVYVSQEKALCISPMLERTGRLGFRLRVTGRNFFSGDSTFTSLSFTKSYDVYLGNEDLLFTEGTIINVHWSPLSIFPMEQPSTYNVDIDLLEMNMATGTWTKSVSLASDIPNTGTADIPVPSVGETETLEDSISPIVVRVGISNNTLTENLNTRKRNAGSILGALGRFALRTVRYAAVRYLKKLARQAAQRLLCEAWSSLQTPNIGQDILNRLPPCPTRIRDIHSPTSGFVEERLSSISPVIGDIQTGLGNLDLPVVGRIGDHLGYTVIDDTFREFFHPETTNCFRQRLTTPALTGGSGQQCCYNGDFLVTGQPGGGTVDLVSPDVDFIGHVVNDVIPYLLCCKAGVFSNCGEYYKNRPSDRGIDFSPPPRPAIVRGDPHIVTLDGQQYTFNGKGEFVLIETGDDSFSLQARMVPINGSAANSSQATVFKAIVGRQNDSDIVQFEITDDGVLTIVNDEEFDLTFINEQEFNNVVVTNLGNGSFAASFFSGAYLEVKEENGIFTGVIVSLPRSFQESETRGLMGSFNGNMSDDLLPNLGQSPLPLDSSTQDIHELFGITWIVDTPFNSLFTYLPGENWATYHDPHFVPIYNAVFSDPELERRANDLCGGDEQCLFDVAATGLVELGLSTLVRGEEFEEIVQLQIPVVCTTPCEFGVCVANNTCYCEEGYEGRFCSEPVFAECEENPCQNGGVCQRFVLDYTCACPSTHTGTLCESELEESAGGLATGAIIGISVGAVIAFLILVVMVIVIAMVVTKKQAPGHEKSTKNIYFVKGEESVKT